MYCTNCGAKITDGDIFCTGCGAKAAEGHPAARKEPEAERKIETSKMEPAAREQAAVAVPIQLRTGLVKSQAAVILIGKAHSALVVFDKKKYQNIVASGNKGGNYFSKVAGMMAAFGEYADALAKRPVREAVAENPGSILFEAAEVKKLKIWNGWDASREQYNEFYSFELYAAGRKYKGTVDKSANAAELNARLRGVLGGRFG